MRRVEFLACSDDNRSLKPTSPRRQCQKMLKMTNSLRNGLAAILVIYAAIGPVAAQNVPENDPVVASAHLWDLDHNGTYTCDEWEQYATRLFRLADRNPYAYVDSADFKSDLRASPVFTESEFDYYDDHRDGRFSREEFVRKPNPL